VGIRWSVAFAAAALLTLGLGAWLRNRARKTRSLRQLGGATLLVAAPVGIAASPSINSRVVLFAALAIVVGVVGLLDERLGLPRLFVPFAIVAASAVAAADGLRFGLSGIDELDVVWTIVFVSVATAAIAALGNADGLTTALVAAAAIGAFGITGFGDQGTAATAMAALVGSAIGFLAYNARPASLYIGRGGGLFAGFTLATAALWARPVTDTPESLVVPIALLGVPLLDALMVVVSRLRHRRRLSTRYRDHLAHRLVSAGLEWGRATATLVAVQVVLTVIALFLARGVLSLELGVAGAAVVLGVLAMGAARGRVSDNRARGFSGRTVAIAMLVIAFGIVASIPAGLAAIRVRTKVEAGRDFARSALRAARNGEPQRAAELFARAEEVFEEIKDLVDSPIVLPSLALPLVGPNVQAARQLADIGNDLAHAGRTLTESVDPEKLRVIDGRVPLEEVEVVAPKLDEAARLLARSRERLRDVDSGFLLEPVREGIDKIRDEVTKAAQDSVRAAAAAELAPAILGQDRPRRYFLAIQNPAEMRGTGGLIGNWGILTAQNGDVSFGEIHPLGELNYRGGPARVLNAPEDYLRRYARFQPQNEWHPVNLSPDWPTVAKIIADLYPQSGGFAVDGVIAVDPIGLAALLELTGPVRVEGWPEPISSENVVDITLNQAYATYSQGLNLERKDFLGDVAQRAVDRATDGDLGRPAAIGKELGGAAHDGHISLWFVDKSEQRIARLLDIAGAVPRPEGDSLLVVDVNGAGNKLDYYLDRTVDYRIEITPDDQMRRARVSGEVAVGLTNTAPASGLPRAVSGPAEGAEDRFVVRQNRCLVSIYTPLNAEGARLDDATTGLATDDELGRNVHSATVDVLAGESKTLHVDVNGVVPLARAETGAWYELTVVRQPQVGSDRVRVRITAPKGFEILEVEGLRVVDGEARATFDLRRTRTIKVRLAPSDDRGLWDRLEDGK
jgi:UDP-N-acetylmuramyl pentapeptide phosphotransferase/UDP-N-acetylglucosamine-1-phosphate transferase